MPRSRGGGWIGKPRAAPTSLLSQFSRYCRRKGCKFTYSCLDLQYCMYCSNSHGPYTPGPKLMCSTLDGSVLDPLGRKDHCCSHPNFLSSKRPKAITQKHWFKDWEDLRMHKLTASTFATAVGFGRRRVQLWLEKLGVIKPFTGSAATSWSNNQEVMALERYIWISGNSIMLPSFQEYQFGDLHEDWLAASADGLVEHTVYGLPYDGVLEIKCPYFGGEVMKAFPWSKIPVLYMPQAQGLMEILDKNWMDLYCWTPNGSSLFRVPRDRQYWCILKVALSDFWWNHVQPAKEICSTKNIEDPVNELSFLRPASKHELYKEILSASKQLVNDSKLLVREIHGRLR